MARLPAGFTRSATLAADASWQGRVFAEGIQRAKAQRLADFASMMRAARRWGPVKSGGKKYTPPPEPDDAVSRLHKRWAAEETAKAMDRLFPKKVKYEPAPKNWSPPWRR